MTELKIGQKWISNAEPELGMGRIIRLEDRSVSLYFDMAAEERRYAAAQAPITRVRFNPGDQIATQDGIVITVRSIVDRDGIFVYHGSYQGTDTAVVETELDANVRFSKPEDRLFTRQIDHNQWFNLRYHSRTHLANLAQSNSRGLYGPRVSLIPHQLYIAAEVASRFAPRVLLADEVGLGKTIEAGLIMHQQLQTGRASRVLIIVPPALTFQWFVEMIRRFNLQFAVMDEERCEQIIADNMPEDLPDQLPETVNPFEAQQLMLCSLDLFSDNTERLEQVLEAEWDLVVVDEAHHLEWSPQESSTRYDIVELISKVSKGLLLLTATPEQLGRAGHFARLRLLDPNRFHDYEAFIEEEKQFEAVASDVNEMLAEGEHADQGTQERINEMLDRHGTGRVLFRNVRSSVSGFPARIPKPEAVTDPEAWLIDLVSAHPDEKFLVICGPQQTAVELEKAISGKTAIRTAVFHEEMDLIARDRAATYFAETDRGAQVLVCSEIGSEGRNFQFASRLVLYDLPDGADLLEQRIGRLDRIGQASEVTIHIPYVEGTKQADLFRWYHEGINAFAEPNPVAQSLYEVFGDEIGVTPIDDLLARTQEENRRRREEVNRGRDRLLELNSHRPEKSSAIVSDIAQNEGGDALAEYMERSFDVWGLESDPLDGAVILVKPTESMMRNFAASIETLDHYHYPELPEDGIQVTFDRDTALAREDVAFMTWENPMVAQALDIAVTDVTGNSAMIAVRHKDLPSGTLLVEALHVVDCVAPTELMVDRYLPPRVMRSVISPNLSDVSRHFPFSDLEDERLDVEEAALHKLLDSQMDGLREMLSSARDLAGKELETHRREALAKMTREFDREITRLTELKKVNDTVRIEEIEYLTAVKDLVKTVIEQADVRLDAIRVIVAA